MNWVTLVLAIVAALIGVGLLWWRARVGSELALMKSTQPSTAKDAVGKPAGTVVAVAGVLKTDAPLTSEFAQKPCIYYRALTEREVEKVEIGTDGKRETRREFETEIDVQRHAPCLLEDASGTVAIDFEGAKVEALQVHRRYESQAGVASLVGSLVGVSGTTLGHRYTEWIIEAGVPVYVLGTALAGGKVGKTPKQTFVVSIKSEAERERSLGRTRMWQMISAVVALIIAAGLAYVSFATD